MTIEKEKQLINYYMYKDFTICLTRKFLKFSHYLLEYTKKEVQRLQ
jgi:hypothetical protein